MSNSQLKSLLKNKRTSAQISHQYARYNKSNLSCSLCGLQLKEVQWSSHLISKAHRNNVIRDTKLQEEAQERGRGKRKHEQDEQEDVGDSAGKKSKSNLPADFFADPSQAPAPRSPSPELQPEGETPAEEEELDDEWRAFEASLGLSGDSPPPPNPISTAAATFKAAPVLYEFGAPKVIEEGEEEGGELEGEEETEEERRERLDLEEREEIMERIREEERVQAEADEKVNVCLVPLPLHDVIL